MEADDYHTVARLGYEDVSSEFIFLQRTMGGMQMNANKQNSLISDIASETRLRYELVEPFVRAAFTEARGNLASGKNNEE